MLCWGQLSNVRPLVDLHEYLLQAHAHLARQAPPPKASRILGTAPVHVHSCMLISIKMEEGSYGGPGIVRPHACIHAC